MRCQPFLFSALSAVTTAFVAPRITPAPEPNEAVGALARRQELTTAAPTTGSLITRTFAYYSGGETEGLVLWAPITYISELYTFTSSGDFWRGCSSTFYATIGTSVSADTECPMFTSCSAGWLVAASTSYFCVQQSYSCYTEFLHSTYGESSALSWLYCGTSTANATNTEYYRTSPVGIQAETSPDPKPTDNSGSSDSTSPSPTPSQDPDPSPSPSPEPAPSKNNTAVIAGSVVGGVAVLAIAGVAVLFILRRSRNKHAAAAAAAPGSHNPAAPPPGTAAGVATGTYPENYGHDQKPVPEYSASQAPPQGEWNPHQSGIYSVGSTSPTVQSAVPAYEPQQGQWGHQGQPQGQQGVYRNELPS